MFITAFYWIARGNVLADYRVQFTAVNRKESIRQLVSVLGFDHLLAMLCVGIVSAQMGGRAIWTVPLTFISVMGLGGFLGMQHIPIPGVEYGIALSVLILGLAVASGKKIHLLAVYLGVAFFAVFHGHAHGAEMPAMTDPLIFS